MKLSKRIALCGLLTATALVLSLVEKMFPLQAVVPIPGVKLGLANVVTLFALHELGIRETAAIVFVRVTLASVFMGSVTGFLFSLFGGMLALIVMRLLLPREGSWFSTPGISVAARSARPFWCWARPTSSAICPCFCSPPFRSDLRPARSARRCSAI